MNGASRTGQIGGISDRGSSPRLYQARIVNILQREGSTTFIATLVNPPTYFRPSQCTSSLSGQLSGLNINDIVSVSINPSGSFLIQGVVERSKALPLQTQEAKPKGQLRQADDLLKAGKSLKKQANQNLGQLPDKLKSDIEQWIAHSQAAIAAYQTALGPEPNYKWSKELIDQRSAFGDLVELLAKMQEKLSLTAARIELPCYIAVEPAPNPRPRAIPVDRKPASAPKPDISSRSISGKTWGKQFTVAGILGKFVEVYGEEADQFLPNQLAHSSLLDYGNFVYTGITILGYNRPLKVYCTKEFIENAAPLLLKAITEGQIFYHNDSFYFGLEEEFIFGNRCFGCYSPQGVMHSDLFKTQHQAHGNGFPFRLTIEGFSKEWTVGDLIRAMAQKSLQAVAVEKVEESSALQASDPITTSLLAQIGTSGRIAGLNGRFITISDKPDCFLPDQLSHEHHLYERRLVEVVDTGIDLSAHGRIFHIYCSAEFRDRVAPQLLEIIKEGHPLDFYTYGYSSAYPEFTFYSSEYIGAFRPIGEMVGSAADRIAAKMGQKETVSLRLVLGVQATTVNELICALARSPLQAVEIEKAVEAKPAQLTKPERPATCQTSDKLISMISTIRLIKWEFAQGKIGTSEAIQKMSGLDPHKLLLWLEYLAQNNNLQKEHPDFPNVWRNNLDDAIEILHDFDHCY